MNLSILNNKKTKKHKGLLYTKMKVFHFKDKLDSLPENVSTILAPIHIRIKPTNVCNHNCWYCAYKADNLQLGKDMVIRDYISKERMMEIIDDIIEMGVQSITFSGGGEPFCYPYLLSTVKKLAQSKVRFAALTNGSKLEGELAEIFAQYGTWLRISIDGWDNESYAWYRGVNQNEFSNVLRNINHFKKLGGSCYLSISLVVDKMNASHTYDFIKNLRDIGVDSIKVSPCIVSNSGAENNIYHQPFFESVKEQIKKAVQDFHNSTFEIFDAYHELDEKFNKDYNWCPFLQILPVIGADLNIYPCQDKAYNLNEGFIGSIKNCHFNDFWFLNKSKFFKLNPSLHCNHHCVANTKNKLILEYLSVNNDHLAFV